MSTSALADGQGQGTGNTGSSQGSSGATGGNGAGNTQASGATQTSWRDSLPDDLKADPSLQAFNDVPSLVKSYIHTKSLVGKKGVVVPGEKATDEEWSGFYKSMGQPELDKFEVKLPDGQPGNAELINNFKQVAHKAGLLPKQAQELLSWYAKAETDSMSERKATSERTIKEGLDGLRKEWGQGWDKEINSARFAAKKLGIFEYLNESGMGNDPKLLKAMAAVGKLFGEDTLRGEGGQGSMGKTPKEIQAEIDNLMQDQKYLNGDKNMVNRVAELFQLMHAG